jgi:hypothetical protein
MIVDSYAEGELTGVGKGGSGSRKAAAITVDNLVEGLER